MNLKIFGVAFTLGSLIFMAGRLSAPQPIAPAETAYVTVIRDGAPVWVELVSPDPTFPTAATASPTSIINPSATAVTPAVPTVTAIPLPACTGYPCDYPADRIYTVQRAVTLRDAPSTTGTALRVWDTEQRLYAQCVREVTRNGNQWVSEMMCGATYTTWTAIRYNGITYLELFIKE